MRLIGYVRVSRVAGREGDSFISPAVQRERLNKYAEAGGHTIVGWEEDLDQPGSRYERPGFQQALALVENGESDGVIVASLDRFARSVPDAAVALRRLDEADGTLVSVRDSLDTSTPVGRFARTMMLAIAELELDRIRENWLVARERAIARGVHFSPRVPLGYRRQDNGRLEPDPATAPIVRELFVRRAAGASWLELAQLLDARLPREDGRTWTRQTVGSIISHRVYLGEAYQGDTRNTEAHQPIVTRAEWEAAQMAPWAWGPGKRGALLSGIIRCAGCGYTLSRNSGGSRGYAFYTCRIRHSAGVCPQPTRISVPKADEYVQEAYLAWVAAENIEARPERQTGDVERAVAALEQAEAELVEYRDANIISVIGRTAYVAGLDHRQRAIDNAREQLAQASRQTGPALDPVTIIEAWPDLTTVERRALLAAAIDCVYARRAGRPGKGTPAADRLHILWAGQGPADLPGRRHAVLRPFVFPDETPEDARVARAQHG